MTLNRRATRGKRPRPADGEGAGRRMSLLMWLGAVCLLGAVIAGGLLWMQPGRGSTSNLVAASQAQLAPFSPDRAMGYLREICQLGPRPSGSEGMIAQQQYLIAFFRRQGAEVSLQEFPVRHPQTGRPVTLGNLVARWHPDRTERVLLCAHYDTRPFPDRDPRNPRGRFIGANDGGSGVAALMELSHALPELKGLGVDIVLFDGEELVYVEDRDEYFLGSTYFARNYATGNWPVKYQAGVLLDMVGDRELTIFYERNSWRYASEICKEIWQAAGQVQVSAFRRGFRHEIRDDHLPLNLIAKIPTVDLIDFDYPRRGFRQQSYWHTQMDIPENCSGQSLASVAAVVYQWLQNRAGER